MLPTVNSPVFNQIFEYLIELSIKKFTDSNFSQDFELHRGVGLRIEGAEARIHEGPLTAQVFDEHHFLRIYTISKAEERIGHVW